MPFPKKLLFGKAMLSSQLRRPKEWNVVSLTTARLSVFCTSHGHLRLKCPKPSSSPPPHRCLPLPLFPISAIATTQLCGPHIQPWSQSATPSIFIFWVALPSALTASVTFCLRWALGTFVFLHSCHKLHTKNYALSLCSCKDRYNPSWIYCAFIMSVFIFKFWA